MPQADAPNLAAPLDNYYWLLRKGTEPYHGFYKKFIEYVEREYAANRYPKEMVIGFSPKDLPKVMQINLNEIPDSHKLTTLNICRIISAAAISTIKDDFFATTTGNGKRNYHMKVTPKNITCLKSLL